MPELRASVEEGARLAAEATPGPWLPGKHRTGLVWEVFSPVVGPGRAAVTAGHTWDETDAAFIAHWNPEFAAELAREIQRLWRVEDAAREVRRALDATNEPDIERGYAKAEAILDAALANPAAEEGES